MRLDVIDSKFIANDTSCKLFLFTFLLTEAQNL
jgi:hypothetical protein